MKKMLMTLCTSAVFLSCNSGDKSQTSNLDTGDAETEVVDSEAIESPDNLMEINTDEALIATALMAAPEASSSDATVIGYNTAH